MMDRDKFEERSNGHEEPTVMKTSSEGAEEDARIEQALADFRESVRNWSDTAYSRPRAVESTGRHRSWRLAAGWALGCVLAAGTVTGGLVVHQHQQEAANIAAQQTREQEQAAAKQQSRQEDQKLMTTVDNEISQQVPSAMEPLAQLMQLDDGETQ